MGPAEPAITLEGDRMLRFLVVVSATTFSSYNPDIAKNRVMPQIGLASPGLWPGPTWKDPGTLALGTRYSESVPRELRLAPSLATPRPAYAPSVSYLLVQTLDKHVRALCLCPAPSL